MTGGRKHSSSCVRLSYDETNCVFDYIDCMPMRYGRFDHAISSFKTHFIIVSGAAKYNNASTVEIFDTKDNSWADLPHLSIARYFHTSCSFEDTIYVFCGKTRPSAQPINSIELLNHKNLTAGWKVIQPPSFTPRFGCGVCHFEDSILILGGWST